MSQPTKPKPRQRVLGPPEFQKLNSEITLSCTSESATPDSFNSPNRDTETIPRANPVSNGHLSPTINIPDIISSDAMPDGSVDSSAITSPTKDDISKSRLNDDEPLSCPICNDEMISLLQLNRHLDDEHLLSNSGPQQIQPRPTNNRINTSSPTEELRVWLKKGNEVKSKIQTVIPRKFVKLDIFDNNTNFGIADSSSRESSPGSLNLPQHETVVTRKHWKKPTNYEICSTDGCNKHLSIKNGVVNCRRCGFLFCQEHTSFRVRLNAEANYDFSGTWCRCCESCFTGKPGYDDVGAFADLTLQFKNRRQAKVDERHLYQNKLEKRLLKLATRFSKIDREFKSSEFNSNFLNFKINNRKREAEQQLVQWEEEKGVLNCFICLNHYSFTLRKHHCRLCGRVVCGSEETDCSKEVAINDLTRLIEDLPRINDETLIRMCRNCKDVLFLQRNFISDVKKELSPLLAKFETQQNVKKTIILLLPKFQDLILRLQFDRNLKNKAILTEASKLRKRLLDSFGMFDKLTKAIIALECELDDEKRLQQSIQKESGLFIQQHMAPLKRLPRILKEIEEETKWMEPPKLTPAEVQQIKANREALMVLNEQKFMVNQMIESCKKERKFDEIPTLSENLKEITIQIKELQIKLGNQGF